VARRPLVTSLRHGVVAGPRADRRHDHGREHVRGGPWNSYVARGSRDGRRLRNDPDSFGLCWEMAGCSPSTPSACTPAPPPSRWRWRRYDRRQRWGRGGGDAPHRRGARRPTL
jgi:hypothetical protein